MRCKDSKQHHVIFHELYSVSLLLCIAQNVRFEIPCKVLYFETPFLIIFKHYAWVSCDLNSLFTQNEPTPELIFVKSELNTEQEPLLLYKSLKFVGTFTF